MIRVTFFALLAAGVLWPRRRGRAVARARRAKSDRTAPATRFRSRRSQEGRPRAVVERIIKNSKEVGDKLAEKDTGTETRKTQDKILRTSMPLEPGRPPPKSDQNKDQDKDGQEPGHEQGQGQGESEGQATRT